MTTTVPLVCILQILRKKNNFHPVKYPSIIPQKASLLFLKTVVQECYQQAQRKLQHIQTKSKISIALDKNRISININSCYTKCL